MTDRPLHPDGRDGVFNHPVKGCVIMRRGDEYLWGFVEDFGQGHNDDDAQIYVGVEVFRARCELGAWLTKMHPDPDMKLINHLFVDAIFPPDFEDTEDPEGQALLQRIDLAQSVIDAGGGCTTCGAPNAGGGVDHAVGCEVMSWMMFCVTKALAREHEPSLSEVVDAAIRQIERMQ